MRTVKGFQWDVRKNEVNLRKHDIDFDEASEVFYQPHAILRSDRSKEERWIAVGEVDNRILAVIFTWRGEEIRIISARRARKNEERAYRNETMGRSS